MATERQVTLLLKVVPRGADSIGKLFNSPAMQGKGSAPVVGAPGGDLGAGSSKALVTVGSNFRGMADSMALLNLSMRPDVLAATAKAQMELTAKQDAYRNSLAKAQGDRLGLLGGFRQGATGGQAPVTMGGVGQAAGGALARGGGFSGALQAGLGAAGPVGMAAGAVVGMGMQGAGMADPGALERFNQAADDTTAVLGRAFVPFLNAAGDALKAIGDLLVPIINPLAAAFKVLLAPVKILGALIGIVTGTEGKSKGAAAQGPGNFVGLADLGAESQRQALGAGTAQEGYLSSIDKGVQQIIQWLREKKEQIQAPGKIIGGGTDFDRINDMVAAKKGY